MKTFIALLLLTVGGAAQRPVHVDPALLSQYVGQYELSPTFVLTLTEESDRLYVRAPGRQRRLLVPTSETDFIDVESGLRIIFGIREDTREVDHLIFEQAGFGRRAEKIGRDVGNDPVTREALALPDPTLTRYVGTYEEQPGFAIVITKEGDQLMAQMTEQEAVAIFAESETDFFYRTVNARISFRVTGDTVEALVLHQGGAELEMRRID